MRRIRPALAALLALAWLAGCAPRGTGPAPEAASVTAALSTNTFHVGDVVTLTVTSTHPVEATVRLPEFAGKDELVVVGDHRVRQPLGEEWARTIDTIRLTSFAPGVHAVSTGVVEIAGSPHPFPPLSFEVASMLAEDTDWRGAKPLEAWASRWHALHLALLGAAVLAVAAAAALLAFVWYRRARRPAAGPPPAPAHETAREALRRLRACGYIAAGRYEPFYVELSAIVRAYLEDRFGLRAPEQTTEEFIREASACTDLTPAQRGLTADFLAQSDLVKFARHAPAAADMENALGAAERLIDETAQREEAEAA